ncbi:MAG TPA: DUF3300 domain-containing protein [Terriglobales bacterium]
MIATTSRKALSVALSVVLIAVTGQAGYSYQAPAGEENNAQNAADPAPQSAEQIQALVAPIALYPDALVAQVLSAATFPDQVALAQNWLQDHKDLTGDKLMNEVDKQDWDPSVKALAAFPSVIDNMAKNLAWTSQLGEVYHFQAKDVMAAVQTLRAKAKAAGNLKSSSQITVVQQSPSTIVIEPSNPQVVYVPQYNPTVIYGTPYVVPGYTAGEVAAASVISFGTGIAIGALMAGGCCHTWGWSTWNVNWHGGYVGWAGHPYYGSAAWHGAYGAYGYHGYGGYGAASYHGAYGSAAGYHGYSANGNYHTGGAYSNAWGSGSQHTTYAQNGAVHTGGSGYNASTGQGYHYGASQTAAGGTVAHGSTSTGQHYAGGTTASGQHYGGTSSGWAHDDGASARAASSRGWGSAHATGGFHGRR